MSTINILALIPLFTNTTATGSCTTRDVFLKIAIKIVVCWLLVLFATFLMKPDPPTTAPGQSSPQTFIEFAAPARAKV